MSRTRPDSAVIGLLLLSVLYVWFYFANPDLPGNAAASQGWWGWFDQGKTLDSARALTAGNLSPERHWYPLGYALLGAPFLGVGFRAHPFVLVDLLCLLLTYAAFLAVARRCGVGRAVAVGLFVFAALWDRQVFREWVIPWNSTPAAALVWAAFALGADGLTRPALLGLLAGSVPLFRPTEAVPMAAFLLVLLAGEAAARRLRRAALLRLAAGAVLPLAIGLALHLLIYGPALSPYQQTSRTLGFTAYDLGWKAYVLLADPYRWWIDQPGLLRRLPWAALAFAGMLPALLRPGLPRMLAVALLAHLLLYLSYLDLLPVGLWRFNNLHYWKWAVPGYALLAWLLVRDLANWRAPSAFRPASAGVALVVLLSVVRIDKRPAAPGESAKMLVFQGPTPGFDESYFGNFTLADATGTLRSVFDVRAVPVPGGMRVLALRRPIVGEVSFATPDRLPPTLLAAPPSRWAAFVTLGRPCWLPLLRCAGAEINGLLPPLPR